MGLGKCDFQRRESSPWKRCSFHAVIFCRVHRHTSCTYKLRKGMRYGHMLHLIIRYPGDEPRRLPVRPGLTTIGRMLTNDIVLADTAVSRVHAAVEHAPAEGSILVRDLGSANGTFVNLQRLAEGQDHFLDSSDVIQIGATEIVVESDREKERASTTESGFGASAASDSPMVHAPSDRMGLLYKVARHLNTLLDTDEALQTVSCLMREEFEADMCEVILASQFDGLSERGVSIAIASMALERREPVLISGAAQVADRLPNESVDGPPMCSALCVPVLNGGNIVALIYLCKHDPQARPFDDQQISLAETVGHMVALTVVRMNLLQRIHDEQRLRQLLQSQLAPVGAQHLLHDYLKTGRLPSLGEEYATVLVADIADSTGWAERLGAGLFGRVLRQYYHDVTSIVNSHGGVLNDYLGDGVMALFGASQDRLNPEECAVEASLEILDHFELHYRYHERAMTMGIGINSGPVVAGYIDTEDRIEFAVLGDTVNVAFGLEALARPNRIVVGPMTYRAVRGHYPGKGIGPVTIKGRAEPVHVFEVSRPHPHAVQSPIH